MIVYTSRTGNVKYICDKLNIETVNINEVVELDDFLIFTYTDRIGEVPLQVLEFMEKHHEKCKGVIASGNTNFGNNNFCKSADILSDKYNIPIIHKIELRGFKSDYELIERKYKELFK